MKEWEDKLTNIFIEGNQEDFEIITKDALIFIAYQIDELQGPQHPAVKYYKARKLRNSCQYNFKESGNPRRKSARKRTQNREKYEYDVAQYNFYNQRRMVAHKIFKETNKHKICKIPIKDITEHFETIFSKENSSSPLPDIDSTNTINHNIIVTNEEIHKALHRIKVDTSPGPDRITVRILRHLKSTKFLTLLANIMLKFKYVPTPLKLARRILIHKGGDGSNMNDWMPITIFSVVRRIIEKVLDSKLRSYVTLSSHQRGFIPVPGTHINASIINGCLRLAKQGKRIVVLHLLTFLRHLILSAMNISNELLKILTYLIIYMNSLILY